MGRRRKIMICVTRQKTCERLIKAGQEIAAGRKAQLYVVHVAKTGVNFLGNPDEGEALDYLFQISKEAGAEMTVLRSDHVVDTLVDFSKKKKISTLVLGESPHSNSDRNIIRELEKRLPGIELRVMPHD
jgi:K+-sensing histidine kinase KdpD